MDTVPHHESDASSLHAFRVDFVLMGGTNVLFGFASLQFGADQFCTLQISVVVLKCATKPRNGTSGDARREQSIR